MKYKYIEFSLLKGWCEILIRRPSGEISWMCQIRSGQLTSNSFSLADISAILFPHTQVITKAKVHNMFIKKFENKNSLVIKVLKVFTMILRTNYKNLIHTLE